MKAIIVENEDDATALLKTLLAEHVPTLKIIGESKTVAEAGSLIEEEGPDIVFLDIDLDDGTAFDLLDRFDKPDFTVIFTTAFDAFALKAFRYNAVDYLLKPYSVEDLKSSVEKAAEEINRGLIFQKLRTLVNQMQGRLPGSIPIYTQEGITIYQLDEIIRFEADRAYCKLILKDGKEVFVSKSLREVEDILPVNIFFRSHKSHLVNVNFVHKYSHDDGGYIVMKNGDHVPVSRRRKDDFVDFLTGSR